MRGWDAERVAAAAGARLVGGSAPAGPERVVIDSHAAGPGDLFYLNPARYDARPDSGWTVVERHGLPPTIGQILVSHLLPAGAVSPALYNKIGRGHPDVTLYRLP